LSDRSAAAAASASRHLGLVVGTAGHIDHGKTSLVRALTGVDTDRLPEEKARGITIELGFAPLELGDGTRVSLVDVPGHEGLVRTMVAGASGIDLALLVVAADEGVMPQTREHVAICELLGLSRAVVALTKIDIAAADVAELAEAEVVDLLASTALAGAPVVRVSAQTGAGVEALRAALRAQALAAQPHTQRAGPPRLAIDRAFAARGFGAVATGTLQGEPFAVGDEVELYPLGLRGRVRGLQVHGEARERATAGARCALNLQGIEREALLRGRVLSRPGALHASQTFDVQLRWLASAPPLSGSTSISFLAGSAERRARIAPIGADAIEPGAQGHARVHLEGEALALVPGERFVARGFSASAHAGATLGGGSVLDVDPPRLRRSDPALLEQLCTLAAGELASAARIRIERAGFSAVATRDLARALGRSESELAPALRDVAESNAARAARGGLWIASPALAELETRLTAALDAYHAAEPLLPGMPIGALRGALPRNAPREVADLAIERLAARGEIELAGEIAKRPQHAPELAPRERALAAQLRERIGKAGLEAPSLDDLAQALAEPARALRPLLAHLEREGALVRATETLWFAAEAVAALRARVVAHLRAHGRIETPEYKALIGATRRTAVPLMELLDAEHITVRQGNARVAGRAAAAERSPGT
jgi:selenocysteine-specific elongation factor